MRIEKIQSKQDVDGEDYEIIDQNTRIRKHNKWYIDVDPSVTLPQLLKSEFDYGGGKLFIDGISELYDQLVDNFGNVIYNRYLITCPDIIYIRNESADTETENEMSKEDKEMIQRSTSLAEYAHRGQFRKYSDLPYLLHPLEVAQMVSSVTDDVDMICAAILHDVIEDGPDNDAGSVDELSDKIVRATNARVLRIVWELTDRFVKDAFPNKNRKERKELESHRLSRIQPISKTIKICDCLCNSGSITNCDPKFAKIYMQEMSDLVLSLRGNSHPSLWSDMVKMVGDFHEL